MAREKDRGFFLTTIDVETTVGLVGGCVSLYRVRLVGEIAKDLTNHPVGEIEKLIAAS